jgi:hypothetical protein
MFSIPLLKTFSSIRFNIYDDGVLTRLLTLWIPSIAHSLFISSNVLETTVYLHPQGKGYTVGPN